MGRYDFTPQGMRNAAMREPCYMGGDDESPVTIIVQPAVLPEPPAPPSRVAKKNSGEELKELLESVKDMSAAEKRFAIKAHYGLLTDDDIDTII